jgi:hypothetical protein
MSTPEFATAENNQELAQEVNCLKALLTLMLQAMGQADAGRVIIKMENKSRRWKTRLNQRYLLTPLSKSSKRTVSNKTAGCSAFSRSLVCHAERFTASNQSRCRRIARDLRLVGRVEFLLHILLMEVNGIL